MEPDPIPVQEEPDSTTIKKTSYLSPNHFRVYPNPTAGSLFADLSDWRGELVKMQLFDSRGQRIQQIALTANAEPQEIQLPKDLHNGLYFLEALWENGVKQTVRFVVQY